MGVADVVFTDFGFDFGGKFRFFGEIGADFFFALADFVAAVAVPSAGFLDDVNRHAEVDDFADARDALTVEDIKFCLFEGRRYFVFHHFDAGLVAQYFIAFLNGADAADVEAH